MKGTLVFDRIDDDCYVSIGHLIAFGARRVGNVAELGAAKLARTESGEDCA